MNKIAVIGAGAAGCFFAIAAKRKYPDADVCIYESNNKALAKLAVTGGGRCNLTNSFRNISNLSEAYPRGEQVMKRALNIFSNIDTMRWFESEGVALVTQQDECVFPVSQDAMQIVRTLERLMHTVGVKIYYNKKVINITTLCASNNGYCLSFFDGTSANANIVVTTTGGKTEKSLRSLLFDDILITPTLPSLFTFKIQDDGLRSLMGVVVENVSLGFAGTRFHSSGTLLITDWGISGPATLRLSSYAAQWLARQAYQATVVINWTSNNETTTRSWIADSARNYPKKMVGSIHPEGISDRLWRYMLLRAGVRSDIRWAELGAKGINRLTNCLIADSYLVCGRAAFKEEFVTCGGVALSNIQLGTLESKTHPGLYFAGEVLDVDAITGGFNLQAAWSTAMVIANHI